MSFSARVVEPLSIRNHWKMTSRNAQKTRKLSLPIMIIIMLVLGLIIAASTVYNERRLAEEAQAHAEAVARVQAAESAQREDQLFFDARNTLVNAQSFADIYASHQSTQAKIIKSAQSVLDDSKGKVLSEDERTALADGIKQAEDINENGSIRQILTIPALLNPLVEKVESAVETWEAEQARLEEERKERERKERERIAAQQRQQQSSGSSQQQSSGSSSSGGSYRDQIAGILSRYGCGGAGIIIDDPRLGRMNGVADWYNNTVLIRSGLGSRLTYVVAHECVHLRQYRVFGGDVNALSATMNAIYGGSGFSGLEQNADCATRYWGIKEYHYTTNCSGARLDAAVAILNGHKP